jgi:hypothetical protein
MGMTDYSEEDDYYGEGGGAVLHLAPPDSEECWRGLGETKQAECES